MRFLPLEALPLEPTSQALWLCYTLQYALAAFLAFFLALRSKKHLQAKLCPFKSASSAANGIPISCYTASATPPPPAYLTACPSGIHRICLNLNSQNLQDFQNLKIYQLPLATSFCLNPDSQDSRIYPISTFNLKMEKNYE